MRTLRPFHVFALAGLAIGVPATAQINKQAVPALQLFREVSWQSRCGGIDAAVLAERRQAALAHAIALGGTPAAFAAQEKGCPKRDMAYYNAVLAAGSPR